MKQHLRDGLGAISAHLTGGTWHQHDTAITGSQSCASRDANSADTARHITSTLGADQLNVDGNGAEFSGRQKHFVWSYCI